MSRNPLVRYGLTTGSTAAAAAKAATLAAQGIIVDHVGIPTPIGIRLEVPVSRAVNLKTGTADKEGEAVVIKTAGDNPDVTDGLDFVAKARLLISEAQRVQIKGGIGVGKVVSPGLPVPAGEWSINPVPMKMIENSVREALPQGYGAEIEISVPRGVEVSERTLNPKLGIVGGISILGTTGIEEPVSTEAYLDHVKALIDHALALGCKCVAITPGNTGVQVARRYLNLPDEAIILVGDRIGETVDHLTKKGARELIVCGLPGKLVKVAAGVFNTHSRIADARFETLAAIAALKGAPKDLVGKILGSNTVEYAMEVLRGAGMLRIVFDEVARRVSLKVAARSDGVLRVGTLLASSKGEVIGVDDTLRGFNVLKNAV